MQNRRLRVCPNHSTTYKLEMNKKIPRLWVISMLLILVIHLSCGKRKSGWEGTIKEQNGVITIKNPKYPVYKKDILMLEEELSLGKKEGEKEFIFTRVYSIDIDKEENIYVLDNLSAEVRVFNKKGKFLKVIGSKGQGPGEMQNPHFIQILNNQKLIIWDPATYRFLIFSLEGEYLGKISSAGLSYPLEPVHWDKKSNLIAFIFPPPVIGGPELVKLNRKLDRLITISTQEKDNSSLERKSKIISPILSCAVFKDNSVIWGNSKRYELQILNPNGKLVKKIIRICKPEKVSEIAKKELLEKFSSRYVAKLGFKPIFPKHFPFFQDISVDEEGRIFVLTFERVREEERFYYLDIFDSLGRYIGKAPMKMRFSDLCWKKKKLYTIEKDEEGFYMVKRYNILWKYK